MNSTVCGGASVPVRQSRPRAHASHIAPVCPTQQTSVRGATGGAVMLSGTTSRCGTLPPSNHWFLLLQSHLSALIAFAEREEAFL